MNFIVLRVYNFLMVSILKSILQISFDKAGKLPQNLTFALEKIVNK